MTSAQAAQSAARDGDADRTAAAARAAESVGTYLAAVAAILRETVARFEDTVGRITETAVMRSRSGDRDVIVALQDFDRLQQEFMALGDVIAHVAATASGAGRGAWADEQCRRAVAAISVADLKSRFLHHLGGVPMELASLESADDVVF